MADLFIYLGGTCNVFFPEAPFFPLSPRHTKDVHLSCQILTYYYIVVIRRGDNKLGSYLMKIDFLLWTDVNRFLSCCCCCISQLPIHYCKTVTGNRRWYNITEKKVVLIHCPSPISFRERCFTTVWSEFNISAAFYWGVKVLTAW